VAPSPARDRFGSSEAPRSSHQWSRAFDDPIITPDGLELRTLRDAGEYIQALSRAKHEMTEWQFAAEMLMAAVDSRGPLMFRMRKALYAAKPSTAT
jgi:hypothetical protein